MNLKCNFIKVILLILVALLVVFSYENTKLIRQNNEHVKKISDMFDTLIVQPK